MNAIEIRGLTKSFSRFKLGPLDLTVPCGAIYALIGPNGAGKTTTFELLLGIGKNDSGSITLLGKDHERDAVLAKRRIGYVSPDLHFEAWGKVKNAIRFVRGFYTDWDDARCRQLMEVFRLSGDEKIATLSAGAKIKLSLILALSHHPALLLLDEPTTGLDPVSKNQFFAELLAMVEKGERTVLISSHGLADIERFADHVAMIKDGRELVEGKMDEIVDQFRMVDFAIDNPPPPEGLPGIFMLGRDAGKYRALIDVRIWSGGISQKPGWRELSNSPVTLEEMFVSLAVANN